MWNARVLMRSCGSFVDFIETQRSTRHDDGAVPMEIGSLEKRLAALERKGKDKGGKIGKGKDSKGKDTGGTGKGKTDGKGKDKKGKPEKFEGYCGICGKWGHKQKDCWWATAGQGGLREKKLAPLDLQAGDNSLEEIRQVGRRQRQEGCCRNS